MSYDLMVFDPEAPPQKRRKFMKWFKAQTKWKEEHGYNDPAVTTPALRAWFLEMIQEYPSMRWPHPNDDDDIDNPKLTDYSVGRSLVYAAFAWSVAEDANKSVFELARKHGVGFFDVSTDGGQIWFPG